MRGALWVRLNVTHHRAGEASKDRCTVMVDQRDGQGRADGGGAVETGAQLSPRIQAQGILASLQHCPKTSVDVLVQRRTGHY